jgi:hypothetical protein
MDISWVRVRSIFGNPMPPEDVWERQFDNFDEELQRLAIMHWEKINFTDLWYYHHDLAYVDLQPEVFLYLFPVCLMDWHETLQQNTSCSHGDSEFHYGVHHGKVLDKMLTPQQRAGVIDFFRDSFLSRLDRERGFTYRGSKTPAYGWMHRFNSLGIILPGIDVIWNSWWSCDTPGRAVAILEYCSGLMYYEGENPLFPAWTPELGGGGPHLWENDSHIYDAGWLEENAEFLRETLTTSFVTEMVQSAVETLKDEPEGGLAKQMQSDLTGRTDIVECRVKELPSLLSSKRIKVQGWTV